MRTFTIPIGINYRLISGVRFYSTKTKTSSAKILAEEFISENKSVAFIPHKLHSQLLNDISKTIIGQRFARLAGILFYPSVAAATGIPWFLGYTFFCVGVHHAAIMRANNAARDLVLNQRVFDDENANAMLKRWILENNITHLSFNKKGELALFSKTYFSSLDTSAWLDKVSLEEKFEITPNSCRNFIPSNSNLSKNTISYFHLADDIRDQVSRLVKARSVRFRTPMLIGATGSFIMCNAIQINSLPNEIKGLIGFFNAACVGLCSNHHSVSLDTEKLWNLLKTRDNIFDLVLPEYQECYRSFFNENMNREIKIIVNIFGDIVINPKLAARSSISILFPRKNEKSKDIPECAPSFQSPK